MTRLPNLVPQPAPLLRRQFRSGVVDETRKEVVITGIIDGGRFHAAWRGQLYECRAFPGTAGLAPGDRVVCHVVPASTELFYTAVPLVQAGLPELWISPGSIISDGWGRSELWVLLEGDTTPSYVWTAPNAFEFITNLAWSKMDDQLYVFAYVDDFPSATINVYRVTRIDNTTHTVALVASASDSPLNGLTDPVLDVAQWQDKLYLVCGAYWNWGNVWIFDPIAETLVHDFHFPEEDGFGGAIATDSGNGRLFASDGVNIYRNDGGGYVYDQLITDFNVVDCLGMLSEWDTDVTYHACLNPTDWTIDPAVIVRNNLADSWSPSLVAPDSRYGVSSIAHQWNEATGALQAQFGVAWGFFIGTGGGTIYRKDAGGAWVNDGNLPDRIGLSTQAIAQLGGKMHFVQWELQPGPDLWKVYLYRRDAPGSYALLHTWADREFLPTNNYSIGMARAPSPTATPAELALMRRCHEVN